MQFCGRPRVFRIWLITRTRRIVLITFTNLSTTIATTTASSSRLLKHERLTIQRILISIFSSLSFILQSSFNAFLILSKVHFNHIHDRLLIIIKFLCFHLHNVIFPFEFAELIAKDLLRQLRLKLKISHLKQLKHSIRTVQFVNQLIAFFEEA